MTNRIHAVFVLFLSLTFVFVARASAASEQETTFTTTIEIKHKTSLAKQCAMGVVEQTDLEATLDICNAAIEENPDDANTYYYRGFNQYYLKNYAAAEADFSEAIQLGTSQLAKAYFQRGEAKERQRKLREASKDFKKALELSPDWSAAKRKVESYAWAYEDE